jgi:hypothetical protein
MHPIIKPYKNAMPNLSFFQNIIINIHIQYTNLQPTPTANTSIMATNPNLLFALESIATTTPNISTTTTTIATPLGPQRFLVPAKDPRHGCINGIKISTCKMCAGRGKCDGKATCTGCKGTGFSEARCNACAIGAMVALRVLIKEVAAEVRAENDKTAKVPDKEASSEEEASEAKETAETKTTEVENDQDDEAETFKGDESFNES